MTRIYVVRHAEAEGNLYRRIHGWYNSRITENGKRQIAALAHRFQDIHVDAAYASDLQRTQLTAQAVVQPKGLELHIDPGLKEIAMGEYEGMPFGYLDLQWPEKQAQFASCSPDWKPEGGESFQEVADRVTTTVMKIARSHPNQTVAIFSHGAAIKCLLSAVRGKHPSETPGIVHCENTGVSCLDIDGDQVTVVFENDSSHLPEEIATLAQQKKSALKYPPVFSWYRTMNMETEARFYYEARKEAWENIYGNLHNFDGSGFLEDARGMSKVCSKSVQCVMDHNDVIGLVQLDTQQYADKSVGYVPFLYLKPDRRCQGIGVQLIGEAVCTYREMGRRCVQLACSPNNHAAQRFYHRYGFVKVGEIPGSRAPLDLLEKEI